MNDFELSSVTRRTMLLSSILAASTPWSAFSAPIEEEEEADDDDVRYKTKVESNLIGDKINIPALDPITLEGVGLVRGLAGTGGDPAPSQYRTLLLDSLKKDGYKNPNAILASPDTALVLVHAYISPLAKKGDRLDVEIEIPQSAEATSLVGGELMEVRLSDKAVVDGKLMEGKMFAIARGPILPAGLGASSAKEPALLRRGRVLGGGVVVRERDLSITLKNDLRGFRMADRVSKAIGKRFHDFDEHGIKRPLSTPKTDQKLVLKVHPRYKDNFPRYLMVIRHLAFAETPVEQRVRMGLLKHDLSIPETSNSSALQLEAIGADAIPILKTGLQAPTLECRFHSAVALAYLGDSSGLPALVESAIKERAFRVFALAAMSTLDEAETRLALKQIMNESMDETRYGAFRALWTVDRNDPFIRGETLGVRENAENHDHEYKLHALKTSGPELVHVTQRIRPEITLFGATQEFSTPMYASAGKHIIVKAEAGASEVTLARFQVGKPELIKKASLQIADVIRAADELGASYPDVIQLLADASRQKNLPATIAVEKLPESGRVYHRPTGNGSSKSPRKIKIGRENYSPNLFPENNDPSESARRREEIELETAKESTPRPGGKKGDSMASVPSESDLDNAAERKTTANKSSDNKKSNKETKSSWSWLRR